MDIVEVSEQLKQDEGYRQFPYKDTVGKLTIGYGRNLSDRGLNGTEAEDLLYNDIEKSYDDLVYLFDRFDRFSEAIQHVLVNMRFQLGWNGLLGFKNMIQAVQEENWTWVAREMKDSLWYRQVPNRADRLINQVERESKG